TVGPLHLQLISRISTLNDLQKLLGTINWGCPLLGITTEPLDPLFELLKRDPELTSP
ncbi:POK18 protein, partial [Orthonyx spaldingii]|nr:POK18 protein [Orthonyx spaldingii]